MKPPARFDSTCRLDELSLSVLAWLNLWLTDMRDLTDTEIVSSLPCAFTGAELTGRPGLDQDRTDAEDE